MADKIVISGTGRNGWSWLGSLGLGAGLMFLLDPAAGRRRRARIRDQATHKLHATNDTLRKATIDLRNRIKGLAIGTRHRLEHECVSDETLVERVRSAMGRYVSHPSAIEVQADAGRVTLSGAIFERQAPRLLRRIRHVRGVTELNDQLERHHDAQGVPALQGPGTLQQTHAWKRQHWPPALRLVAGTAGFGLTGYGLQQRGVARIALSGAGLALTLRSLYDRPIRRMVGIDAGYRAVDIQKDIHVSAPVEEVFSFFENVENLPRFMAHLKRVTAQTDGVHSHWEAAGPAGVSVRWDAERTKYEPNRLLAWKSLPGAAVRSAGIVRFDPQDGGTRIDVRMSYNPPAGALGHAVAHMFGTDPKQALDDDLLRLKTLLEAGKATVRGETVTRDQL